MGLNVSVNLGDGGRADDGKTEVEVKNGDIKVTNGDRHVHGKKVSIENDGVVYVNNLKYDTDRRSSISIEVNGDVSHIRNNSGSVNITGTVGEIENVSGDITVNGNVAGDVSSISGNVTSKYIHGDVTTISGNISV
jgi:hypothetical protein